MSKILNRNYTTGWYSLRESDAINGLRSTLSARKGVKNICIGSCYPTHLEGDVGYKIQVSYQEDLDQTFGFPENLNNVIFLNVDSYVIPYDIRKIALETQAGIVIATSSIKDEYYDTGNIYSEKLLKLMEEAHNHGIQIVGITPSERSVRYFSDSSVDTLNRSISSYLKDHPSIKKFLIVTNENKNDFWLIRENEIPWIDREKNLNGKTFIKK